MVVVPPRARDLALVPDPGAESRLIAPVAQVCSLDEVAEAEDRLARHARTRPKWSLDALSP